MGRRLVDDVYDVLEGSLADLLFERQVTHYLEALLQRSRLRRVRAAVAMLCALLREGHAWRPAEDGHEATRWRELVLDLPDGIAEPRGLALITRELEELVMLAPKAGPRRPLPPGSFERLARRAGVSRTTCTRGPRSAGDDHIRGWNSIEDYVTLSRVAVALGLSLGDIARTCAGVLRQHAPRQDLTLLDEALAGTPIEDKRLVDYARSADDEGTAYYVIDAVRKPTVWRVDSAVHGALKLVSLQDLRERLTTPAVREQLAHPERA